MSAIGLYFPTILSGALLTVEIGGLSLLLAVLVGLLGAWGKLSPSPTARFLANAYTVALRSVPSLVLLLLGFYGGQRFVLWLGEITGLWSASALSPLSLSVVIIGAISGAYMTETFRGAYLTVPRGQIEVAVSFGMKPFPLFFRIVLPQALRFALPGLNNNWLVLLKDTALTSVLGLNEVLANASAVGRKIGKPFTFLFIACAVYLMITALSDAGVRRLENLHDAGTRR